VQIWTDRQISQCVRHDFYQSRTDGHILVSSRYIGIQKYSRHYHVDHDFVFLVDWGFLWGGGVWEYLFKRVFHGPLVSVETPQLIYILFQQKLQ
jgi:hypothetical protein